MKIGILGGTFDPIHKGHLALAKNAQEQFLLDKVILIPAYAPPHKKNIPFLTSAEDRYKMVKLAIGQEPFFEVSDCEMRRKGISYTIDTLEELELQYPKAEFYLILGQDAFEDIDKWRQGEVIKKKVTFLVANRRHHDTRIPGEVIVKWIQMPIYSISASEIRSALKHGQEIGDFLVPEVYQYIQAHHLYRAIS